MPPSQRLPHLRPIASQPIVFLTVVTHERRELLANYKSCEILEEIWSRSPNHDGWTIGRYLLMPDHVHLFARGFHDAKPLSRWVQTWKSLSSRALTCNETLTGPIWQKDYFDRFLRSADDYSLKWEYVAANPVRQGLVRESSAWRWQGILEDLSF